MKYYAVNFGITPFSEDFADILSACIAEVGFETFETTDTGLCAYIQRDLLDETVLAECIEAIPLPDVRIAYTIDEAPDVDWNQEWEKEGFRPIVIGDLIGVHDTLHEIPVVKYDIIIKPRQAFGTGSHQTTRMILSQLAEMDLEGLNVIDAGTGTGILSIMAMKRMAKSVLAYDIDEWSVENTKQNLELNHIHDGIEIRLGDASTICNERGFDLLIANINRNILLVDMPIFRQTLKPKGKMILSGFYTDDVHLLQEKATSLGFTLQSMKNDEDWAMLLFEADALGRMDI